MTAPPAASLRALLAGSVDYAGLFPPAGLALELALANFSSYQADPAAWLLARFVLPTTRFREAGALVARHYSVSRPLAVSALGEKSDSAADFFEKLRAGLTEIAGFRAGHGEAVRVEQLETPLPPDLSAPALRALLRQAADLLESLAPDPLTVFWEVPLQTGPAEALGNAFTVLAEHNAAGRVQPMGAKLRTGGIIPAAFPSASELARALVLARDAGVPLKFTAGLHHPVRHFNAGMQTRMHGFLNVFAAGALAREHGFDETHARAILDDENAGSFRFSDRDFAWRDFKVSTERTAGHRAFITTFGSCSFDEPRDDLRALGLL